MKTATYRIVHPASESIAIVELTIKQQKIELIGCYFIRGNVMNLTSLQAAIKSARTYLGLSDWDPIHAS